MAEWFIVISDKKFGPIDTNIVIDHIKAKKINQNTLIWKEGNNDWVKLSEIQDFAQALKDFQEQKSFTEVKIPKPAKENKSKCFCRNCGSTIDPKAVVCMTCGANPVTGNDYCNHCGNETNQKAIVCVKCGCNLSSGSGFLNNIQGGGEYITSPNPPKDPILMALLSGCCLAWLGQILIGQTTKGLVMLAVSVSLAVLGVGIIFWPIAAVDAYLIAKKLKEGKPVKQWEFF